MMRCARCGGEAEFHVHGDADIHFDGHEQVLEAAVADEAYDGDAQAFCQSCGHDDPVSAFRKTFANHHHGEPWYDNGLQFTRLLAEVWANVTFASGSWDSLCASMDLKKADIEDIFRRADDAWTLAKEKKHVT
jgi:hypothetical protein